MLFRQQLGRGLLGAVTEFVLGGMRDQSCHSSLDVINHS